MRKALLAVALLLIASCGMHTPSEPMLSSGSGKLVVTVVDAAAHQGLPNVTVQVYQGLDAGPLVTTGVTNAAGVFETSLAAGGYRVQIVPPANYAVKAITGPAGVTISEGSTVAINLTIVSI